MNVIEVDDLMKEFNGKSILNGISFDAEEGDVFGFLGPNGAGKTTTMRILLGLLEPTSGRALVFGRWLGDDDELRRRVGVLLENDGLYVNLSAYENLNYFAQIYSVPETEREGRIRDLLDLVGLSDRGRDRVGEFSKGMRRRLALARSMLHDPDVLFLDEPSSGLDPEAQLMVRDLILRLSRERGRTVFLNSHDLDEVQRICSKAAILQRGEVKAYDTIGNLVKGRSRPTVEITLADGEGAEGALSLLHSLDYVSGCEREGLKITVGMEYEKIPMILDALMKGGIRVEEVKKLTRPLEDIYLSIVRRSEEERT